MTSKTSRFFWIAGLLLFVFILGVKGMSRFWQAREKPVFIADTNAFEKSLTELSLEKSKEKIVLKKKENAWRLALPEDYPTEEARVKEIIDALKGASLEDRISQRKDKLESFDLEGDRSISIEAKDDQGKTLLKGFLGKQLLGHWDRLYWRSGQGDGVYVLKGIPRYYFERTVKDFKSKLILEAPKEHVSKLELVFPKAKAYVLARDGATWKISGREAKKEKADDILNTFQRLEANDFAEPAEVALGLKKLGLEPKAKELTVKIFLSDGKAHELLIGAKKDTLYFAKLKDNPTIWKLAEWKVNPLLKVSGLDFILFTK